MSAHGTHIHLDYTGYTSLVDNDGEWLLQIMRDAVAASSAREVHSHVEQFDGEVSPEGFAAVVLIDESHVSAHCYSKKGWLAIDCFTCGSTDPNSIADYIHMALERVMPDLELQGRSQHDRFLH